MKQPKPAGIARREEILRFISEYQAEVGIPPSRRDIAARFGISAPTVQSHIDELVNEGRLRRTPGIPRALVITQMKHPEVEL